ncbi:hypothetical protein JZ751_012702 [Albula glossodonta]|uniref:Calponin-homology (CH) domain-containing protein n=1 Tax=Albula glossodonta TaxID=121402 RepID=A0A8T2N6R8_9TELE|nr:hypothetical protein JZ751_012702 [Albula glossodonta]
MACFRAAVDVGGPDVAVSKKSEVLKAVTGPPRQCKGTLSHTDRARSDSLTGQTAGVRWRAWTQGMVLEYLSRNRLTDIPSEVCHFIALETLNLYHNCIRTIPDSIITLQSLTSLDLSRNQIVVLPACLCSLPLRVLNASNNKLGALPESIGQLTDLMDLDVSCNEITTLPPHVGRLKSLRELSVRRNFLCALPEELAELPLVKLDVSCNKACRSEKMADSLYLPVMDGLSHPSTGSSEDIEQSRKQDTDSGVGSDNGDKRLSATEPSDEDSLSLSAPMSHISEEQDLCKDDSSDHISALTVDPQPGCVQVQDSEGSEGQTRSRHSGLTSPFGRTADYSEPLRIEEDSTWASGQTSKVTEGSEIHIEMINQLREAVELLQNPDSGQDGIDGQNPLKSDGCDGSLEFQKKRDCILERARLEAQLACQQFEKQVTPQAEDKSLESPPKSSPPFGLKPRSAHSSSACSSPPCLHPLTQALSTDSDPSLGIPDEGSEHISAFLRNCKGLDSGDPQFTMRRRMEQLREEMEMMGQLREVVLSEDLGGSLMDGVVLCHLANHIRPRSVASIHPKLSMAKCRRNVENFLDVCRRLGVPEEKLCLPHHILEEKGLLKVCVTVQSLIDETCTKQNLFT